MEKGTIELVKIELLKAQAEIDVQKMAGTLNRNELIEHLMDRPSADLRKYLETLPLDTLRILLDNLNSNAIADKASS